MYVSHVKSSSRVCGRDVLLARNDVVKLLRWDLLEVLWLRLGRSLFKPIDVCFTQGSLGSPGGCVAICCFLAWESAHAFIGSKLASNITMRWMDCVYLGICFMVTGGRFGRRVLSCRAEQCFQQKIGGIQCRFWYKAGGLRDLYQHVCGCQDSAYSFESVH